MCCSSPASQLRGLLLVFYLLVDKDDIPLVIDQPEENLDNQTLLELLVPCMKEAKRRRQVSMVTHNLDLAVVCEAEQILCADLDKTNKYTMNYLLGAIENPKITGQVFSNISVTMTPSWIVCCDIAIALGLSHKRKAR